MEVVDDRHEREQQVFRVVIDGVEDWILLISIKNDYFCLPEKNDPLRLLYKDALLYMIEMQSNYSTDHPCRIFTASSDLSNGQIPQHLPAGDVDCPPQSVKVKSARKCVTKSKWQHARNPTLSQFQRPTSMMHLVLLDITSSQMMNSSLWISLHFQSMGRCGPLFTLQNVKVIISSVSSRVACLRQHNPPLIWITYLRFQVVCQK